jgi:hypothetical protein
MYNAQGVHPDTLNSFNVEAMKVSSMGVTITISSGDDGVASDENLCDYPSGSSDFDLWQVSRYYCLSTSSVFHILCFFSFFSVFASVFKCLFIYFFNFVFFYF